MPFWPYLYNQQGGSTPYDEVIAEMGPTWGLSATQEPYIWPTYEEALASNAYNTEGAAWVQAWINEAPIVYPTVEVYIEDDAYPKLGPDFHEAMYTNVVWSDYSVVASDDLNGVLTWGTDLDEEDSIVWPTYTEASVMNPYTVMGPAWVQAWMTEYAVEYPTVETYIEDDGYDVFGPDFHESLYNNTTWSHYDALIADDLEGVLTWGAELDTKEVI